MAKAKFTGEHSLKSIYIQVPRSIETEIRDYIKRRKNEIKQQIKNETK